MTRSDPSAETPDDALSVEEGNAPRGPAGDFVSEFTRCQRKLYLLILSQVGRPTDAEEILQETNLIVWRKADSASSRAPSFFSWAARIASYEVLKHAGTPGTRQAAIQPGVCGSRRPRMRSPRPTIGKTGGRRCRFVWRKLRPKRPAN